MTTSPVGLQVTAVPQTLPSAAPAAQSSTTAAAPDLATAIAALSGAIEALKSALAGAQGITGGGAPAGASTSGGGSAGGCGCGQATAGAGALGSPEQTGANAAPEQPKEDKPKKPKRGDDAKPAESSGAAASAPSGYKLQDPLPGASHTSGFGEVSSIRNGRAHGGYDLARPSGTAIKAAAPGKVVEVKNDPDGYGNYVTIDHGNGRYTRYAHMVSKSPLTVGQTVGAGDTVGKVGSTGNSTGPHLHFEVLIGGLGAANRKDPEPYLKGQKAL